MAPFCAEPTSSDLRLATLTANQHDAISAVELALAEAARLAKQPLHELASRDTDCSVLPLITIVTDNGGPFRSFRFEAFIATHPELRHVRTRVRSPGQNGSRERGFGTLKYQRLSSRRSTTSASLRRSGVRDTGRPLRRSCAGRTATAPSGCRCRPACTLGIARASSGRGL